MTVRSTWYSLVTGVALLGCTNETGVAPDFAGPPVVAVEHFELRPDAIVLVLEPRTGNPHLGVHLLLRDTTGHVYSAGQHGTLRWSSDAPSIATVSGVGRVTGIAPGTTRVVARVRVGGRDHEATSTVTVLPVPPLLTATELGWQPDTVSVPVGTNVRWVTQSATSWSGVPHRTLWLLDEAYQVTDSLHFRDLTAARVFTTPGVIRYCSGGCWDPPDFGTIRIHF